MLSLLFPKTQLQGGGMLAKALSVVLVTCALFSGQLMAGHKGHEFLWVKNVDHQLRHVTAMSYVLLQKIRRRACASISTGKSRASRKNSVNEYLISKVGTVHVYTIL